MNARIPLDALFVAQCISLGMPAELLASFRSNCRGDKSPSCLQVSCLLNDDQPPRTTSSLFGQGGARMTQPCLIFCVFSCQVSHQQPLSHLVAHARRMF